MKTTSVETDVYVHRELVVCLSHKWGPESTSLRTVMDVRAEET